jgi:hypothetical protein
MKTLCLMIVVMLCSAIACHATGRDSTRVLSVFHLTRPWYVPDYFPFQYAGNIGLISAGAGYVFAKDRYQLSLVYGYTPKSIAGVTIHTLTARNVFHLYRIHLGERQTLLPYAALGLSFEIGGRSFFTSPSNMPPGYYKFPKSVHVIPGAGLKLRYLSKLPSISALEFFGEVSTVDAYVWYKIISDEVSMSQILSLSVGIHLIRR